MAQEFFEALTPGQKFQFLITAWIFLLMGLGVFSGVWLKGRLDRASGETAKSRARDIIRNARAKATQERKEAELNLREERIRQKAEIEKRMAKKEAVREQKRQKLEAKLERKAEQCEERAAKLREREEETEARQAEARAEKEKFEDKRKKLDGKLQAIAGMTADEARREMLTAFEDELRSESAALIRRVEAETREIANKKARQVVTLAVQKCAAEVVTESTVSVVQLAREDMKGRIIGREGRNIRALEAATGVNIIVDDTPEAVVLSCYDPLRREVARLALEQLLADGRIHPARIEEVVQKTEENIAVEIKELGERTFADMGIHDAHPDVAAMFGRLNYRTSFGQNIMAHSVEVAHLCGVMAAELGADERAAKRAGLLHDVGKAMPSDIEGSHALVGAEFCKRLGESAAVVHAIAAHHNEEEPKTIVAVLLQAADAMSASRPGARRESLESYVKRLKSLEGIANDFPGVAQAYALQAGRELRVIVEPEKIGDEGCLLLAREVRQRVEAEHQFPGSIKVTVLRETRVEEFARRTDFRRAG